MGRYVIFGEGFPAGRRRYVGGGVLVNGGGGGIIGKWRGGGVLSVNLPIQVGSYSKNSIRCRVGPFLKLI